MRVRVGTSVLKKKDFDDVYKEDFSDGQRQTAKKRQHLGLDRQSLRALKRKAIRRGAWFRALNGIERGIVDLVVRCTDVARNSTLVQTLARIFVKLSKAMNFTYRLEEIGRPIAERMSEHFQKLGNEDAWKWKYDGAYARCLGLNQLNSPLFARLSR